VSRRTAALAGFVAWLLLLLLLAPRDGVRGIGVFGLAAAVAVTVSIVVARLLSKALRDAVLKGRE
jgi:hypothetical protein